MRSSRSGCKKQYSVKVGTIFEDSALGLDKWLPAIWLIANSKNGISSHELGRALGITQKSAWFVLHRICLAMIERGGRVQAQVVPNVKGANAAPPDQRLRCRRLGGLHRRAVVLTAWASGSPTGRSTTPNATWTAGFHTSTIENFWSLVKRGLNGTYVSVEPVHLFRSLDERVFTFNERERTDYGRFGRCSQPSTVVG